jgi:hypothetical protein
MGTNRNVAQKIIFRPKTLGGLEMHDLYTIQGTTRLQYFLGHVMYNDGNGNLIRICMESTQLEVGTYEPFLFLNYKMAGSHLLKKAWLTAIWEHLSLSNETITTIHPWLPQPQIEHAASCSRPPQVFQTMPGTIVLRTARDGSVENEKGYHGGVVATLDNATIIEGHGPTDGRIQETTSYQTEVLGTIAILIIYNMIVKVYNWKAKEIEHVCDSKSALDRIWNIEPDGVFDQSRPYADVILLVAKVQLQKAKNAKIVPTWVRGHANKRGQPYTNQEKINMRAGKHPGIARKALTHDFMSHQDSLHFPEQHILHRPQGQKLTSKITRNVAHSFHRPNWKSISK